MLFTHVVQPLQVASVVMHWKFFCAQLFFRIIFPVILLVPIFLRFNLFTLVYLILLLLHPFIPSPGNHRNARVPGAPLPPSNQMLRSTQLYLIFTMTFSIIVFIVQVSMMINTLVNDDSLHLFECGTTIEKIVHMIGFRNFRDSSWQIYILFLLPDFAICIAAIISFLSHRLAFNLKEYSRSLSEFASTSYQSMKPSRYNFQAHAYAVLNFICLLAMIAAATSLPSCISVFYVSIFLVVGTLWSLTFSFFETLNSFKCAIINICAINLLLLYVFQFQILQDAVDENNFAIRLFGLTALVNSSCLNDTYYLFIPNFKTEQLQIGYFLNPFMVLLFYMLITLQRHHLFVAERVVDGSRKQSESSTDSQSQKSFANSSRILKAVYDYVYIKGFSTFVLLRQQSYLLSVLIMILWSVICHGVIGLVFLLLAIYLWVIDNSKFHTFRASIFLIVVCPIYIFFQFLTNMDYVNGEFIPSSFNFTIGSYTFSFGLTDIRLVNNNLANVLYLGSQCVLMLFIWDLHRQRLQNTSDNESDFEASRATRFKFTGWFAVFRDTFINNITALKQLFAAFWMILCLFMVIYVSTHEFPSITNQIYMVFYLIFIIYTVVKLSFTTQIPDFNLFLRAILAYTILLLLVNYLYQFTFVTDVFPWFAQHETELEEIGLSNSTKISITLKFLPLAVLLIVLKIQFDFLQVYFNGFISSFKGASSLTVSRENEAPSFGESLNEALVLVDAQSSQDENEPDVVNKRKKIEAWYGNISNVLWLLLRIHLDKVFCILIFVTAIHEVNAFSMFLIVLICGFCVLPHSFTKLLFFLATIASSSMIMLRMVYQLWFIKASTFEIKNLTSCTFSFDGNNSTAEWFGVEEYPKSRSAFSYISVYLVLSTFALFDSLIRTKLEFRARSRGPAVRKSIEFGILFFSRSYGSRKAADESAFKLMIYLINFIFYKFSLEFTVLCSLVVANCRANVFSVIYLLMLLIPLSIKRTRFKGFIGKIYVIMLSALFVYQFAILVWIPPIKFLCDYIKLPDWLHYNFHSKISRREIIQFFLFIPGFSGNYELDKNYLWFDFFQMLFFRQLLHNLCIEQNKDIRDFAGNNENCLDECDRRIPIKITADEGNVRITAEENPEILSIRKRIMYSKVNFIHEGYKGLNLIKSLLFVNGMWVTYAFINLTGLHSKDIFGVVFLTISFYFLLIGQNIALRSRRWIIVRFNALQIFVIITATCKICLQVVVFLYYWNIPGSKFLETFVKFLNITVFYIYNIDNYFNSNIDDIFTFAHSIVFWEIVTFIFVTFQRRIFLSYYYDFVMQDAEITKTLSVFGSQLVQEINKREIRKSNETRRAISDRIHKEIEDIKKSMISQGRWVEPKDHLDAIFSGERFFIDDNVSVVQSIESSEAGSNLPEQPDPPAEHKPFFVSCFELIERFCEFLLSTCTSYRSVVKGLSKIRKDNNLDNMLYLAAENEYLESTTIFIDVEDENQDLIRLIYTKSSATFNLFIEILQKLGSTLLLFILAQTNYICYFLIVLNMLISGAYIDLILPLVTFCWALLCKPRPTKSYWSFCIFFTAFTIFLKYFFQFRFLSVVKDVAFFDKGFWPFLTQRLLGLENVSDYLYSELILLIFLCLHRNLLADKGLWVAYTENKFEQQEYVRMSKRLKSFISKRKPSDASENDTIIDSEVESLENESPRHSDADADEVSMKSVEEKVAEKIKVREEKEASEVSKPSFIVKALDKCDLAIGEFIAFVTDLVNSDKIAAFDVYTIMFVFDLCSYIILIFGYSGFSSGSGNNAASIISSNQVPGILLAALLVFFTFTLIDRLAYIKKWTALKICHYFAQIIVFHIWLFIINPPITKVPFAKSPPVKIMYFFRSIYWTLSAYEIKCSYPLNVFGNVFAKSENAITKICMIIFVNIPFLFEIRVLMDWVFTPTTLSFFRWLEVEDAFSSVFILKCTRLAEKSAKRPRGKVQEAFPNKLIYFLLLLVILIIIWAPILLFSFVNQAKVPTDITSVSVRFSLSNYEYILSTNQKSISEISNEDLNGHKDVPSLFMNSFTDHATAWSIDFSGSSGQIWTITPPSKEQLYNDLISNSSEAFRLYFSISVTRNVETSENTNIQPLASGSTNFTLPLSVRQQLATLLNSTGSRNLPEASLGCVFPLYILADNNGAADIVLDQPNQKYCTNVSATIQRANQTTWWIFKNKNKPDFTTYFTSASVVPSSYSAIASYGVLGLYITFVLVASSMIKGMFVGYSHKIMFNEIPDLDPILKICRDMFMCREQQQFELEEDLYSKLQYLYRSPQTMINVSKFKTD